MYKSFVYIYTRGALYFYHDSSADHLEKAFPMCE